MAIKQELWDQARVMFEAGKTLVDIEYKTGINYSSIGKKAKKEGWEKSKNSTLIDNEIKLIKEKSQLNPKELEFHESEVERLSQDTLLIRAMTRNNLGGVNEKLTNHDALTMLDHKNAQDLIDKASITLGVNDRHAKPATIQQNTQNNNNNEPVTRIFHVVE